MKLLNNDDGGRDNNNLKMMKTTITTTNMMMMTMIRMMTLMTLMMIMIYPEARMTVPFSAITKIGGEFVLKQRSFILVTVILTVMIVTSL